MAKYRVSWSYTTHTSTTVEADSEEQALRIVTGEPESSEENERQQNLAFEDEPGEETDAVVELDDDDPECDNCGRPASEHSGGNDDFSHCPMSDERRNRVLAEAARTECCKACHGSGRVLESDDSVLKTTCMACLGTGRVDKR